MANTDGPWIRFYASDWLAGTRGMTAAETGVYITLIATMYERAAPIPRDDSRLARVCGLPTRNFALILERLIDESKILVDDHGNLWGRKVETEVLNRSARAEKSRMAAQAKHEQKQGPKSASAPRKQAPSSAPAVPRARASEPEPDSKDVESLEASQRKRACRLPPDWIPLETDAAWLRSKWPGIARSIYDNELEKFRNYWHSRSGQGATKLDWSKTWRNWMLQAQERTPTARAVRQPTSADVGRQLLEEMQNAASGSASAIATDHPPTRQLGSRSEG